MHLDSQHAPGFPAAAVAAIGQAGRPGGSWGRHSCFRKAIVLFCPLASLRETGSTGQGDIKQTEALKQLYRAGDRSGLWGEEPDINTGASGQPMGERVGKAEVPGDARPDISRCPRGLSPSPRPPVVQGAMLFSFCVWPGHKI